MLPRLRGGIRAARARDTRCRRNGRAEPMDRECDLGIRKVGENGRFQGRAVQEWILFIKTKNIDPMAKNRFIQAIDYLCTELGNVKTQLEAVQDGTLQREKTQ